MLVLCGCANHNAVTFSQTKSFWSGEPILRVNLPFPEPLSFELPNASWRVLKVNYKEGVGSVLALAEGAQDSYVKVQIEGQNRSLFESLENESGVDFSQSDSLILLGLFDHYKTMTQMENAEKEIAYGVIKTRNQNYFTIEVYQKRRATDVETILTNILKSRKSY